MEELLMKRSFVRWIKGECSSEEKEYWDSWLEEDPNNHRLVEEAREVITAIKNGYETPDPKVEVNKLDRIINQYENQRTPYYGSNYKRLYRKSRGAIAAGIILLILLLSSIYAISNYTFETQDQKIAEITPIQEYNTANGERLHFHLNDGSKIILNANSSLKFTSKIEKGLNTEVWLEGEAYFNIVRLEKGQQRKFTVYTKDGSIQVLGTRFAVNTFGNQTQTVLEEGEISLRVKNGSSDKSLTEYLMKTGELAQFNANDSKIAVREVNTLIHTSWTENKLIFKHTPVEEVAQRIKNTFGVEVLVSDKLSNETISGSIKSDNLDVLTEALAEILNVTVKKQDRKLFIGTEN